MKPLAFGLLLLLLSCEPTEPTTPSQSDLTVRINAVTVSNLGSSQTVTVEGLPIASDSITVIKQD